jgi:hypothetical protein
MYQRRVLSLINPVAGQFVGNMDTCYPYGTQLYQGLLSSVSAFSGTNPPTQGGAAAPISPAVSVFAALNCAQFGQILTAFPNTQNSVCAEVHLLI